MSRRLTLPSEPLIQPPTTQRACRVRVLCAAASAPKGPFTRPLWLLPKPQALQERQSHPLLDGHIVQLLAGPERIESGWWDGGLAERDYFIGQTDDGLLVWLYRTRPQRPFSSQMEGWFLHGRFA